MGVHGPESAFHLDLLSLSLFKLLVKFRYLIQQLLLSVFLEHILLLRGIKVRDHRGDVFELVADSFLCLALDKH
jgi:hypothetical protein